MSHIQGDEAEALLEPVVMAAIGRVGKARFSTRAFIEAIRSTEDGETVYQDALETVKHEGANDHMALLVLHGQVFPALLRKSGLLRFAGFIHGRPDEDDGLAVPSWWRRV